MDPRRGLDLALLWQWHRPAFAPPIRPLAWEPPYALGAALLKKKKKLNTLGIRESLGEAQFLKSAWALVCLLLDGEGALVACAVCRVPCAVWSAL